MAVALTAIGCTRSADTVPTGAPDVPYAGGEEVERLVASASGPTLIEFCVPMGCFRCDEMRPSINTLAQDETDRLTVRRVNLNADRRLAAEWGVTVCPTYVVVADGREVGRAEYPTSADLVWAMVPCPPAPAELAETEAN